MGNWISKLFNKTKEAKIIMIGLDGAGKTTILYKLKLGEIVENIPTIGFNVETIKYKSLSMNVWDIGGQTRIRQLWYHYYNDAHGIIFVVDSTDVKRFKGDESVEKEIKNICLTHELEGVPLLILANKSDCREAVSVTNLIDGLGLYNIKNRAWNCIPTSAITGTGIYEGLDWLSNQIYNKK